MSENKEEAFQKKAKEEARKFAVGFQKNEGTLTKELLVDTYAHVLDLLKCFRERQVSRITATLGWSGTWTVEIEGKANANPMTSEEDTGREHDATDDLPKHIEDKRELELGSNQAGEPID